MRHACHHCLSSRERAAWSRLCEPDVFAIDVKTVVGVVTTAGHLLRDQRKPHLAVEGSLSAESLRFRTFEGDAILASVFGLMDILGDGAGPGSSTGENTYLLVVLFAYCYLCKSTSLLTQIRYNCSSVNPRDCGLYGKSVFVSFHLLLSHCIGVWLQKGSSRCQIKGRNIQHPLVRTIRRDFPPRSSVNN